MDKDEKERQDEQDRKDDRDRQKKLTERSWADDAAKARTADDARARTPSDAVGQPSTRSLDE